MMDSLLLLFAARISKRQVKRKRIFLGAAAGSLLTCLVIALPIPSAALKMILFHGFVNVFMLKAGLGVNWGRDLVYAWILLYVSGFLLGGAMMVFPAKGLSVYGTGLLQGAHAEASGAHRQWEQPERRTVRKTGPYRRQAGHPGTVEG